MANKNVSKVNIMPGDTLYQGTHMFKGWNKSNKTLFMDVIVPSNLLISPTLLSLLFTKWSSIH